MLIINNHPDHNAPLDAVDAATLSIEAARETEYFLTYRDNYVPTPLHTLNGLAKDLGVGSIHIKDESYRLGMGSFKALGGSYAVIRLVLEEASKKLGRKVDIAELSTSEIREVAEGITVGCATDGNHGKSVAAGAALVGAKSAIFVHSGVSDERVEAIANYGAEMIRIDGTYDDSVRQAERICKERGWMVVSDTSWPGYEHVPALVMQGYTVMLREAIAALPERPTHIFMQAGVGGLAASVAGYFDIVYQDERPFFTVVEPDRAACIFASATAGKLTKADDKESTIMAMLECYEPSLVAWRILSRKADAFITIGEEDAAETMRRLARPVAGDPAIVAGESGGAGLAGLICAMADPGSRDALGLDANSRIFLINTEGATDKASYEAIVGAAPERVVAVV